MDAVLSGGLRLPAVNLSAAGGSRKSVLDREIADGYVWFTFRRPSCFVSMSSTGSEGGRSNQAGKNSPPGVTSTKKPNKLKENCGGKSSNPSQLEIITLFKRMQSSIAEGPDAGKKRLPKNLRDELPGEFFTTASLRHPAKKRGSSLAPRRNPLEKKQETQTDEYYMMSRPVSNFIKRSPIRSLASAKQEYNYGDVQKPSTVVSKQADSSNTRSFSTTVPEHLSWRGLMN